LIPAFEISHIPAAAFKLKAWCGDLLGKARFAARRTFGERIGGHFLEHIGCVAAG